MTSPFYWTCRNRRRIFSFHLWWIRSQPVPTTWTRSVWSPALIFSFISCFPIMLCFGDIHFGLWYMGSPFLTSKSCSMENYDGRKSCIEKLINPFIRSIFFNALVSSCWIQSTSFLWALLLADSCLCLYQWLLWRILLLCSRSSQTLSLRLQSLTWNPLFRPLQLPTGDSLVTIGSSHAY